MPVHKIGSLLATPGELRVLYRKAQHLLRLQQVFSESVPPPFAHACRVKDCREGTLFILTDSAAIAAKLRQLAPRLLVHIQKQESQVTGIQIAVQVRMSQKDRDESAFKKNALSTDSIEKFKILSREIPDSPLKSALTNLVRRHTRQDQTDGNSDH